MKITYDAAGTPGIWAAHLPDAYRGLGWIHGRHRPLQALILHAAGRACLSRHILPKSALLQLDGLVLQLDLPARGEAAAKQLGGDDLACVLAYLRGFETGLRWGGEPWETCVLLTRLPQPTVASTLSGLMLSAYLGLSEGQERMERVLVHCLNAGADAAFMQALFAPHLDGWDPAMLRGLDDTCISGSVRPPLVSAGGSNAWAVTGARSASGHPILCGDPHLQVNQLPAIFCEVRACVGDDYWLGASIPGLPGIAVGRNRNLAWTGTFSCADNVDFAVETLHDGRVQRGAAWRAPDTRTETLHRRGLSPRELTFATTERGVLLGTPSEGRALAKRWAAVHAPAEALGAYIRLPTAHSAAEAGRILERAHTLSLHWVLADRSGDVRYQQAGTVPQRQSDWSGLYPVAADDARRWSGLHTGHALPQAGANDGMVVSANEARLAADGSVLATLAQPAYRMDRIRALLAARHDHDIASMAAIQRDVLSAQGLRMRPLLVGALLEGPLRAALQAWDGACHAESIGAHAFATAYNRAQEALGPLLGGPAWTVFLQHTEARVWFATALDRLLGNAATWKHPLLASALSQGLATCAKDVPQPWGKVQTFECKHMVFGDLPRALRLNRGPFALPGNITTVSQGNLVPAAAGNIAVAPAYRMVCDLGEDVLHTALPGGIDGSCFAPTYANWLDDWRAGALHVLRAPSRDEAVAFSD